MTLNIVEFSLLAIYFNTLFLSFYHACVGFSSCINRLQNLVIFDGALTSEVEELLIKKQAGNNDYYFIKNEFNLTNIYKQGSALLGEDWCWWLIPTMPVIRCNNFELPALKNKKTKKGTVLIESNFDAEN